MEGCGLVGIILSILVHWYTVVVFFMWSGALELDSSGVLLSNSIVSLA